jgi:hypothetical protein
LFAEAAICESQKNRLLDFRLRSKREAAFFGLMSASTGCRNKSARVERQQYDQASNVVRLCRLRKPFYQLAIRHAFA